MIGTPWYMAPEVCEKLRFSPKSDVWSVGATVHEMYTGLPPNHHIDNWAAIMYMTVTGTPPQVCQTVCGAVMCVTDDAVPHGGSFMVFHVSSCHPHDRQYGRR